MTYLIKGNKYEVFFLFLYMVKNNLHIQNEDLKRLGDRIRDLRIKKGYSNYESFAYDHNIARAQYGKYENGENLRYSSLLRVIKALGVSIQEFFSEGFE